MKNKKEKIDRHSVRTEQFKSEIPLKRKNKKQKQKYKHQWLDESDDINAYNSFYSTNEEE